MNILTRFKIIKPASEVFEAFVDPEKIGGFWFSSSSERWVTGKDITLRYDEYNATVLITVTEVVDNKKIVFKWGSGEEVRTTTITLDEIEPSTTIIEITEEGFKGNYPEILHEMLDNKEGWVFMLTCLKAYLEFGITGLRAGIAK
ncbi:SRPBCC family protein [Bacillus suaedaesalsae]|uniref:SRPBCC family protein n=1 Tax=Bacillus suaedaesalsae TaxID=2810349 RepID=A0ABS2DDW8_9BACI|nr:SRPBCC family protein [Bacillus suaedaesalsae]MBM6616647.1 SRPBCC family protein [Bacillus suaedaesalsae]